MEVLKGRFATVLTTAENRHPVVYNVLKNMDVHNWPTREEAVKEHARICKYAKQGVLDSFQELWINGDHSCWGGFARLRSFDTMIDYYVYKDTVEVGFNEWETRIQYHEDGVTVNGPGLELSCRGDDFLIELQTYDGDYTIAISNGRMLVTWECEV